jgi:hypothetical protein
MLNEGRFFHLNNQNKRDYIGLTAIHQSNPADRCLVEKRFNLDNVSDLACSFLICLCNIRSLTIIE